MISEIFLKFLWNIIILTSLPSKLLKFCEIRKKFGEDLAKISKICFLLWNSAKIVSNSVFLNGAKVLKNQMNQQWCKGKNVELEKCWKMRPWTQKSALIQPRTSLGKGLKNGVSKGPRWLYRTLSMRRFLLQFSLLIVQDEGTVYVLDMSRSVAAQKWDFFLNRCFDMKRLRVMVAVRVLSGH